MTIYARCGRKGKRADQVAVQVGANQLKVQVGQHAKQSIPPLKVLSRNVPSWFSSKVWKKQRSGRLNGNMSVEDIMASQDKLFPKAVVAPKPKFVMGELLVSNERLEELPTHMRHLHAWYLTAAKKGRIMIMVNVPQEYYGRPEEIHVDFDELF
jgi:hypothetical protein